MGKATGKSVASRFFLFISFIICLAASLFSMLIILFPLQQQIQPLINQDIYGFWNGQNSLNWLGVAAIIGSGVGVLMAIISTAAGRSKDYAMGDAKTTISAVVWMILVTLVIMVIGLLDKPNFIQFATNNTFANEYNSALDTTQTYSFLIQNNVHWTGLNLAISNDAKNVFLTLSYAGYAFFGFCCITIISVLFSFLTYSVKVLFSRDNY